ncbi:MAG: TSUP family transporter [Treponema sp.]|nr:TSUP family transporter [Treponema sp.]
MELTFVHFLIICPLVFIAGFVDAIAGGGGLISLPAYLISGLPVHQAIGTNKLSSAMGTTVATVKYAINGYINWKISIICALFALAGSNLGAHLNLLISDYIFKIVMLIILPLTAFYVVKGKDWINEKEPYTFGKTLIFCMLIALVIGIYDGFYGPGTGTFLILLLTTFAHLSLTEANGITKVINLTTNITSLVVFWMNGTVLIVLGLTAGVFGMAGNLLGARFFSKGAAKITKPIMITVITIFFIKVLYEIIKANFN